MGRYKFSTTDDDKLMAEIENRVFLIVPSTQSRANSAILFVGFIFLVVAAFLIWVLAYDVKGSSGTPPQVAFDFSSPLPVRVIDLPTETPRPTHTPTPRPTHDASTPIPTSTPDPKYNLPFCGDPIIKEQGGVCLPYQYQTPAPIPTATPYPMCTIESYGTEAQNLEPCTQLPDPTQPPPTSAAIPVLGEQQGGETGEGPYYAVDPPTPTMVPYMTPTPTLPSPMQGDGGRPPS